ncbi:hypothetical protein [Halonatronum saccharophilum]|uniref:hypothetical protein n=1 Tax=Halonatronum saccharophilum TaxID=150060 RepID=UPI0004B67930|nr:hypothetical protein [Halonatronum saccharophilum]
MAQGPKEIKANHKESDNPKSVSNEIADTKEFVEQEWGDTESASKVNKGYPQDHSMPALFGWITQEYQREIAKDLVEMGKEIEPKKR